jgi:ABC-type phosphate transport system auxiliary subunit
MAGDSEYAQRQFLVTKAEQSRADRVDDELRMLRRKMKLLEDKVSSLSTELSRRNVIGETPRGFS